MPTKIDNSARKQIKILVYISFLYFCGFMIFASISQFWGFSNDYKGYKMIFTFDYGSVRQKTELFFSFLRFINDLYFHSSILSIFIFTSFFSFILKWNAFKQITDKSPYFIFFCHTLCFYWILEYTQIRASCAIAIFMSSIPDLINKDSKNYLLKSFVATLFHYSASFMFILYLYIKIFRNKKWYIFFPIFGFIFAIGCDKILGSQLRDFFYLLEKASGLNKSGNISDFMSPFNLKYLLLLFSFLMNAIVTPEEDTRNIILLKIMSLGLCFYYWLNPLGLPVVSVRLAEFFTSVFVLYLFLNIKNFPIKEKMPFRMWALLVVFLYASASLRTAIL